MTKKQIFLAIPAKASSGGFVPDILPILTATTTDKTDCKTRITRIYQV